MVGVARTKILPEAISFIAGRTAGSVPIIGILNCFLSWSIAQFVAVLQAKQWLQFGWIELMVLWH